MLYHHREESTFESLIEWLKVREKYIESAIGKSTRFKKQSNDDRLFPFENNTAYQIWYKATDKAGFSERGITTNFMKVHPHVLRKFFRTRLGAVIPVDIVEALMGHEGYLTEVYRRYSFEELAEFYKRGEHALLIFTANGAEVGKLRAEIEERNKQLQTLVNGLSTENLELKARVARQEIRLAEMEGLFTPEVKAGLSAWAAEMKKSKQ